ncbi:MAG: site-specific DNA-methyltransferase, partial [Dehalococcoidia bacterium]|nr:site-specific DNA-methyltransferase [Dehalococcoidia bacterium]
MEWGLRDYGTDSVRIWGGLPGCEHKWGESLPAAKDDHRNIGFAERSKEDYLGGGRKKVTIAAEHHPSEAGQLCSECGAWRGSLGLEPHPQMFVDSIVEICREIKRVLKSGGTFWLNLGDTYYGSGGKGGQYEKFMPDKGQPAHYRQSSKSRSNWLQPKQRLMMPARVAIALQHDGWILRNDVIWHKPNHMPSSVKDRLTVSYEHVFLFAKQRRYYFDL